MQLKSVLKGFVVLTALTLLSGLAAVCIVQRQTIDELRAQQKLQEERMYQLAQPPLDSSPRQTTSVQDAESETLREKTKELLRLRNEVTQLRKQIAELEKLRAANADLLQAVQGTQALQSNQLALITSARRKGAILGVTVQAAEPGRTGVIVTGVDPSSPVATSGMLAGDLIFALDGKPIQNPGQLQAEMLTRNPGDVVVVDVARTNASLRFQVQTRAFPQ